MSKIAKRGYHKKMRVLKRKNLSLIKNKFSRANLAIFALVFSSIGGYLIYHSFASDIPAQFCPDEAAGKCRPYDPTGAWNTPIGANPTIHPNSANYIQRLINNPKPQANNPGTLTSDITQYTQPVYLFDSTTTMYSVTTFDNGSFGGSGPGSFSTYDGGDKSRVGNGSPWTVSMPIPQKLLDDMNAGRIGLTSPSGNDAQVIIWDPVRGIEYGLWQVMFSTSANPAAGHLTATNGYKYHTTTGYYGSMAGAASGNPSSGGGRGAGTSYFSGLVRPWEIAQGHIDHALSFASAGPSPEFVYPATKSDGGNFNGVAGVDPPEGTRLQLDPTLTDADFTALGLNAEAKIVAKALQDYGAYIIDNSGSTKVYLEQDITAHWDTTKVNRSFLSKIPMNKFRVVVGPTAPSGTTPPPSPTPTPTPTPTPPPSPGSAPTTGPTNITATNGNAQATINWTKEAGATSYKLHYRASGASVWIEVVVGDVSTYTVTGLTNGTDYNLQMQSVNSAGNSAWVPSNPVKMNPLSSYTNPSSGPKPGDLNGDGVTNITDLSLLLSSFGQTTTLCTTDNRYTCNIATDPPSDNKVDIYDLSLLLSSYGL